MPSLLLQSLFPLVFIMLLGWLSGKLGYTRREDANVLATVVIRFALPFHLFIGALNTDPGKIKNMARIEKTYWQADYAPYRRSSL